ncbi:MAG: PEP-CTERM sorting domain-containing protein, partial [Planctomycetota bacterium]
PQLDFDIDILPGIVPTLASATVLGAGSIGETGFAPLIGPNPFAIHSIAGAAPDWPISSLAFAGAGYISEFTATGDTTVGFGAFNVLNLNLSTMFPGEHAAGFAFAGIFVKNLTTGSLDLSYDLVYNSVQDGGSFNPIAGLNVLSVGRDFYTGNIGIMGAIVASGVKAEPVPEPTTMALFGIGMVGLVGAGARRKFKKEKKQ